MIWGMFAHEAKKNAKDKGLVFWMLVLPIVFIVLFGFIFSSETEDTITHIVPGYTVMFTFYIIISMVISCVKDLESGMTARLASTSMKQHHYLIGKWLPYVGIVLIQITILLAFGKLVYNIQLGNLFALLVLSIALAIITTGWGMAISLLVKNENAGIGITQVIALGGAMLGGLWMPLEFLPSFIQKISTFLPQYWAQKGYLEVMIHGGGIADIWLSVLILLAMGAAGLLIAIWSYPRFLGSARS